MTIITKPAGIKVHRYLHLPFNQSRNVTNAPELLTSDCEGIQSELADQNIVRVVRLQNKVNGEFIPLATLFLTFNIYKLPSIIKA